MATYTTNKDGSITKKMASGATYTVTKDDPRHQRVANESVSNTSTPKATTTTSSGGTSSGGSSTKKTSNTALPTYTIGKDGSITKTEGGKPYLVGQNDARYQRVLGEANAAGYDFSSPTGYEDLSQMQDEAADQALEVPEIEPYESQYSGQLDDLLSEIGDRQFTWDPNTDKSWQAYLTNAQNNSDVAFKNQIGTSSAMTGGRPNSWAQSVASQAQNNIMQSANAEMGTFENNAFNRYQAGTSDLYNQANLIMSMDDTSYARYMDSVNQEYTAYTTEYNAALQAIQLKQDQISQAIDRTNMNGYVSNADAQILGIAPMTPSPAAQAAAQEKLDKLDEIEAQTQNELKIIEANHQNDVSLEKLRSSNDIAIKKTASVGSGSAGTSSGGVSSKVLSLVIAAANKTIDSYKKDRLVKDDNSPSGYKKVSDAALSDSEKANLKQFFRSELTALIDAGGDLSENLANVKDEIISHYGKGTGQILYNLLQSATGTLSASSGFNSPTSGNVSDWLDEGIIQTGVGNDWKSSLQWILDRESSGGDPTAQNPKSSAYGMFQFLDKTWAGTGIKKTDDPVQQTIAAIKYIKSRYGTAAKAVAFYKKNGWY